MTDTEGSAGRAGGAQRPIIFSGPMVRAILDGRKTQTRRIIRVNTPDGKRVAITSPRERFEHWEDGFHYISTGGMSGPYGPNYQPGDRLWVREAWHPVIDGHPVALYRADNQIIYHDTGRVDQNMIYEQPSRWRSPIHMPRWASRITLLVEDVRVQRVQEISEEDAIEEGCRGHDWQRHPTFGICTDAGTLPSEEFQATWDSLHRKLGDRWCDNPWVAAITFSRIEP